MPAARTVFSFVRALTRILVKHHTLTECLLPNSQVSRSRALVLHPANSMGKFDGCLPSHAIGIIRTIAAGVLDRHAVWLGQPLVSENRLRRCALRVGRASLTKLPIDSDFTSIAATLLELSQWIDDTIVRNFVALFS